MMRLKLDRLRALRNSAGTMGTAGTAIIHEDSGVPAPFPLLPPPGTQNRADSESLFPVFPPAHSDRERETSNVYAPVPTVPGVPTSKQQSVARLGEVDPLAGEPVAWETELHRWASAQCVFRDRSWGGLVAFHRDYVDWSHATGNIPPATFPTFRVWVAEQGFVVAGALVHGVVLKQDLPGERWESFSQRSVTHRRSTT